MQKLTVVILDDEAPARSLLEEYIQDIKMLKLVASFGNPVKAVKYLKKVEVDLLFLDIDMPEMNGFDVVDALKPDALPQIIFSTAYDEYAIRAFDINAIDYLLKPYTKERFKDAIKKLQARNIPPLHQQKRIESLLKQVRDEKKYPERLFIKTAKKIVPVKVDDILWIEAEGDYSILHLKEDQLLCSKGLGKILADLDPDQIVRIHRSHAIALNALENLETDGYGGFIAFLQDGTELKVSRNYSDEIKDSMV